MRNRPRASPVFEQRQGHKTPTSEGKNGNFCEAIELNPGATSRVQNGDEFPLRFAVDQAWTVHLSAHKDVNAADSRRCSLERYLRGKWQAGESDPDELTCYGLSYLARLRSESW